MSEFDHEPVPGLPERLPAGEDLIWQGAPSMWPVASHVLHIKAVGVYFAALSLWRAWSAYGESHQLGAALVSVVPLLLVAAAALGLILLVAWLTAKTTIYSITSKRVVMRYGMALPVSVNIPYSLIHSADLRSYSDGSGDIALAIEGHHPLGYYHLWPHARPWRVVRPQPMLRTLAKPVEAASVLSKALHAAAGRRAQPITQATQQAGGAYSPPHAAPAAA